MTPADGYAPDSPNQTLIEQLIRDIRTQPGAADLLVGLIQQGMEQSTRRDALPRRADLPRVLSNGADVVAVSDGTKIWAPPSRFSDFDFSGGRLNIKSKTDRSTVQINVGAGSDCLFTHLTSSCFASLTGFTEGETFYTLSGCTFQGYSTVQAAATAIAALAGNASAVLAICPGTYNEDVTFSGPAGTGLVTVIGAGRTSVKIVGQASAGAAFACTTASVRLHLENLTITGHASANSTAINGDATNSQWSLRNVDIVTGADAAAVGVDTAGGTALTRWRFEMCSITGSGIGFGDRGGGSADAWGNVELHNCYIATAIAADFVGDANFWMVGGRVTGAIGFRCSSGTASSLLNCDQVNFTCSTSAVQIANAISFNDLQMQGCFFDSCATALDFSGTVASTARRYRVEDCHFKAADSASIGVNDPSGSLVNAVILGNTFEGYTTPKEITGRTVAQWAASGVQIAHNATDSGTPIVDTGLGHWGVGSNIEHHTAVGIVDNTVVSTTVPYLVVGPFASAATVTAVEAVAGSNVTAGATSGIYDVHKILAANENTDGQGTTIFTTQGNRPTISNGNKKSTTTAPDVTAIAAGDLLAFYVDQQGTSLLDVTIAVRMTMP